MGTCPDLGTVEPVPQPLRWIARRWSRQLAAAQTIVVVEAGGRTVSLGDILGPEFAASPKEMFGPDRFHPSAAGYASAAAALLPSVCAALDVWFGGRAEQAPDLGRGEGVPPIALAAVEAADAGRHRGRRRPRSAAGSAGRAAVGRCCAAGRAAGGEDRKRRPPCARHPPTRTRSRAERGAKFPVGTDPRAAPRRSPCPRQ